MVWRRNEGLCRCKRAGGISRVQTGLWGETDGLIEEQLVVKKGAPRRKEQTEYDAHFQREREQKAG